MTETETDSPGPRSIRQRRILDLAAENPNASFADLAERVPSATPELAERVLNEYGDPGDGASDDPPSSDPAEGQPAEESPESEEPTVDTDPEGEASVDGPVDDEPPEGEASVDEPVDDEPPEDDAEPESSGETPEPTGPDSATPPPDEFDIDALSRQERETLLAIRADPSATQREIAEVLGVSRATVSNRIRGIDGLEWDDRQGFVRNVFDELDDAELSGEHTGDGLPGASPAGPAADASPSADERGLITDGTSSAVSSRGTDTDDRSQPTVGGSASADAILDRLNEVSERVAAVEDRLDEVADASGTSGGSSTPESVFEDPELVHKIVRACVTDDAVSEEEELRIIRELVT
ncbi:winged helix-turn-helix domain-containing protein [Halobellus ruber]|uniref:Winged helix-turn-helix transcriptional regulator n=1 Tax=Halobellus ruber TaxID=2761102 RepID=A0A7J9SI27_9EURY|nr:winged helix-turn-helix domain-containing protein [Halobellus ruber]MBB6646625.1 winged helix-turn-helix transcriptional regulator [Halobellus ruber]